MGLSIEMELAEIGLFNCYKLLVYTTRRFSSIFFLEIPPYSAPRTNLLSSDARKYFADGWSSMSKAKIVSVFL